MAWGKGFDGFVFRGSGIGDWRLGMGFGVWGLGFGGWGLVAWGLGKGLTDTSAVIEAGPPGEVMRGGAM